jgi:histidine triad (HIT) family protein
MRRNLTAIRREHHRKPPSTGTTVEARVLCAIAAGTEPSRVVIENNRAKAFLDINPAGLGHTLVIPSSHASSVWEPNDEDAGEVWRLTLRTAHRLKKLLEPEGLTLFQANCRRVGRTCSTFTSTWYRDGRANALIRPWEVTPGDPSRLDEIATRLIEANV